MHYSPVRHSPAGIASYPLLPSDLHVLGLPPAFNLSHDQTFSMSFELTVAESFRIVLVTFSHCISIFDIHPAECPQIRLI